MRPGARTAHSEHLRDPAVAAEYLNAALEDGDPSVILMTLRNVAEAQEGGIAGVTERAKLGRESMYKMLLSSGNPKLSRFTKLIRSLGLHIEVHSSY